MEPIKGVDISQYQWPGGIPFTVRKALMADGVRFAIARISIGLGVDVSFEENRKRLRAFEVSGGYHYLTDRHPGKEQAHVMLDALYRTGGLTDFPIALDVEDDHAGSIWNEVSLKDVKDFVRAFKDAHPKHPLGLYANRSTWGRLGNPDAQDLGFDWAWNAYWTGAPPFPARPPVSFGGFGRAPLWQYGTDRIPFGKKIIRLDGNAFYGTIEALRAYGQREVTPMPDRPAYKAAYAAELDRLISGIHTQPDPAGTPTQVAGTNAARDEAIAALEALREGK